MPNIRIDLKNSSKNLFIGVLPGLAFIKKYQGQGEDIPDTWYNYLGK